MSQKRVIKILWANRDINRNYEIIFYFLLVKWIFWSDNLSSYESQQFQNVMKEKQMAKRKLKKVGKFSKCGILETWVIMFRENEKKKLTDEAILKHMKLEFPGQSTKSKIFNSVRAHRSFYNRGILPASGGKPKKRSVPYEKEKK